MCTQPCGNECNKTKQLSLEFLSFEFSGCATKMIDLFRPYKVTVWRRSCWGETRSRWVHIVCHSNVFGIVGHLRLRSKSGRTCRNSSPRSSCWLDTKMTQTFHWWGGQPTLGMESYSHYSRPSFQYFSRSQCVWWFTAGSKKKLEGRVSIWKRTFHLRYTPCLWPSRDWMFRLHVNRQGNRYGMRDEDDLPAAAERYRQLWSQFH